MCTIQHSWFYSDFLPNIWVSYQVRLLSLVSWVSTSARRFIRAEINNGSPTRPPALGSVGGRCMVMGFKIEEVWVEVICCKAVCAWDAFIQSSVVKMIFQAVFQVNYSSSGGAAQAVVPVLYCVFFECLSSTAQSLPPVECWNIFSSKVTVL